MLLLRLKYLLEIAKCLLCWQYGARIKFISLIIFLSVEIDTFNHALQHLFSVLLDLGFKLFLFVGSRGLTHRVVHLEHTKSAIHRLWQNVVAWSNLSYRLLICSFNLFWWVWKPFHDVVMGLLVGLLNVDVLPLGTFIFDDVFDVILYVHPALWDGPVPDFVAYFHFLHDLLDLNWALLRHLIRLHTVQRGGVS